MGTGSRRDSTKKKRKQVGQEDRKEEEVRESRDAWHAGSTLQMQEPHTAEDHRQEKQENELSGLERAASATQTVSSESVSYCKILKTRRPLHAIK